MRTVIVGAMFWSLALANSYGLKAQGAEPAQEKQTAAESAAAAKLATGSLGANAKSNIKATQNVFGDDDRRLVVKSIYPWCVCGQVLGANSLGSGALVGPDIVLTAAHCVLEDGELMRDLTFKTCKMKDHEPISESRVTRVWVGTRDPQGERDQDWALLLLADRLGDQHGWLGCADTSSYLAAADFPDPLVNAGYPGDIDNGDSLAAALSAKVRNVKNGLILHDADTTRGSSGSPMFVIRTDDNGDATGGTIYAINVAEYRDGDESLAIPDYDEAYANIAIHSSSFLKKLKELRSADIVE